VIRKFESLAFESATLHAYLREISNFPALTPDDERQLGRRVQQDNDEDALARLVQANLRVVVHYAKRFRHLGVPLLDLIHEGNLGLIEAARRFDPSRNEEFQAAALWWIRQAMMHLLSETRGAAEPTTAGLMAAATRGRQIEAIRTAIDYALSAAAGQDVREPAPSDAEDFAAHLRAQGRRKNLRNTRKKRTIDTSALHPTTTVAASALRALLN
jgi:RNA polymerase sigma factor (sigma-70 family)